MNKRIAEMLGYVPDEIVGSHTWGFVYSEDREMVKNISMAKGDAAFREYDFRFQSKDGETIWVNNLATIIQYQGNHRFL